MTLKQELPSMWYRFGSLRGSRPHATPEAACCFVFKIISQMIIISLAGEGSKGVPVDTCVEAITEVSAKNAPLRLRKYVNDVCISYFPITGESIL